MHTYLVVVTYICVKFKLYLYIYAVMSTLFLQCLHLRTYACICADWHHVRIFSNRCAYMHVLVHICAQILMYERIHTYMHGFTYGNVRIDVRIYPSMRAYTHICGLHRIYTNSNAGVQASPHVCKHTSI